MYVFKFKQIVSNIEICIPEMSVQLEAVQQLEKISDIIRLRKKEIEKLEQLGRNPIVSTSPIVRTYFKKLTDDYYKDLIVVSYNEIESNVELQSVGMVTA